MKEFLRRALMYTVGYPLLIIATAYWYLLLGLFLLVTWPFAKIYLFVIQSNKSKGESFE